MVERARWLVMFLRMSAAGTPALRQSIGMTVLLIKEEEEETFRARNANSRSTCSPVRRSVNFG